EHQWAYGDDAYAAARRPGAVAVSGSVPPRIQFRGGVEAAGLPVFHQLPAGFLTAIQQRCRRHGIQLIVDEVKAGLARSGRLHCFQHEDLEPDLVVFGKGLGGGLPLSALIGPRAIMDHAPAFALQTTAGNPVATAAGLAVLRTIAAEQLVERAANLGRALADGLRALARRQSMI